MADGLKMLLAMGLFFGAMWLYAIAPDILEARRQKKRDKQKLQKEAYRKVEKVEKQKLREEIKKVVDDRRSRIKEHFKWLKEMNAKIQSHHNTSSETFSE